MPQRFEIYIVYKWRYINTLPFLIFVCMCVEWCCSEKSASKEHRRSLSVVSDTESQSQTTVVSQASNVYETEALATIQETATGQQVFLISDGKSVFTA